MDDAIVLVNSGMSATVSVRQFPLNAHAGAGTSGERPRSYLTTDHLSH